MGRNKFYLFLATACTAGYVWIFVNTVYRTNNFQLNTCIIKHVTDIPCPSCGTTRSMISILNGDFVSAMLWNPLGFVMAFLLIICPLLISYDLLYKKQFLLNTYLRVESYFKIKKVAIPMSLLIIGNWIWNIYKDL